MNDVKLEQEQFENLINQHQFRELREKLEDMEPSDIAALLADVSLEMSVVAFRLLPKDLAVRVFDDLELTQQQNLLESFGDQGARTLLEAMPPDDRADLLDEVPAMVAKRLLSVLSPQQRAETLALLGYAEDTAGRAMIPNFVDLRRDMTAAQALQRIRTLALNRETVYESYVMDEQRHLLGTLALKDLVLASPETRVVDIMTPEPKAVDTGADQNEAASLLRDNNLLAVPVVDKEKRLVGIITWDDVADIMEEEATEDMYKMAGIPGERVFGPLKTSIKNRLPWLLIYMATTFVSALIISFFEPTIAQIAVLAVFLPMVAGHGGIAGTQTLTLVVRSMVLREVSGRKNEMRLLTRELCLGIVHGLLLATIVGTIVYIWKGSLALSIILALAMIGNMIIAGLLGAGIPLVLSKLKIDPAVASAVVVTTFTDMTGFFLFLGLATLLIRFLM